ncbi:hypothetical protein Hanom_Chr00s122168g01812041 [Helianthus anomalus]
MLEILNHNKAESVSIDTISNQDITELLMFLFCFYCYINSFWIFELLTCLNFLCS